MFTPKYPPQDTAPIPTTSASTTYNPMPYVPAPVPSSNSSAVQLTAGSTLALVAGGTAAVLIVGTVLVSMLLAVAITAASVAVCAVTVRSILKSDRR